MTNGEWQIIVAAGGFAVVGKVSREGLDLRVDDGAVIHRFDPAAGLGPLAANGPLSTTEFHIASAAIYIPESAVLMRYACDAEKWGAWHGKRAGATRTRAK